MVSTSEALLQLNIQHITDDSRSIKAGDAFLVMPGAVRDGAEFVPIALEAGAACLLVHASQEVQARKHWLEAGAAVPFLLCWNDEELIAALKAIYPSDMQSCVAVTGTDGKSSVVHFTRQLWEHAGRAGVSLGTIGVEGKAAREMEHQALGNTTPGMLTLYKTLHALSENGVTDLAMEVSSHALVQGRVRGMEYDAAAFTNLSHEHLDYHKDMEDYFLAKAKLFTEHVSVAGRAVICTDDAYGVKLAAMLDDSQLWGYGTSDDAVLKLLSYDPHGQGAHVCVSVLGEQWEGDIHLIGDFQVMNMLAASGLACASGVDAKQVIEAWPLLTGPEGRMQSVSGGHKLSVLVDYAHTPGALEHVLKAARPHCEGRLWVVFGCGGDRDNAKRPVMGRLGSELADIAIITDDNPRTEDAASIRAQVRAGVTGKAELHEIGDRAEAIAYAIDRAEAGDMVIIAGKGHEKEQIIGTEKYPFDDVAIAKECLR